MRFDRMGHYSFNDTNRKRLAFARKQKKEQERYPLFAEQIAEEQHDVDAEMALRQDSWSRRQVKDRAQRAQDWIRARAALAAYPTGLRQELLAYWQRCQWPGTPSYLLSMLQMHANGRLNMYPEPFHMTEERRQAVAATIKRLHDRASNKS
jgi:hypothetical protein